jgi:hypothetical protein
MSSVANRPDVLHRWRASLSDLERRSMAGRSGAEWRNILYAKVLRYLIARYEDERCWNRYAVKSPPAATSSPARACGSHESVLLTAPVVSPPRSRREMLRTLQWIHAANIQSYRHFGIPVE